jgi:hypothetical protein
MVAYSAEVGFLYQVVGVLVVAGQVQGERLQGGLILEQLVNESRRYHFCLFNSSRSKLNKQMKAAKTLFNFFSDCLNFH